MLATLPYGRKQIHLEIENAEILEAEEMPVIDTIEQELVKGLEKPVESPSLRKLSEKAQKILLIIPDNTRAFPSREIIPILVNYIGKANPRAEIRILVATGLHLKVERGELAEMLGKEVVENYEVVNHDAADDGQLVKLDKETSYGTPIHVNRYVFENDLVIGTGLIEPHFFAGYSGGRKILLPGVAGKDSIFNNHGFEMIGHPKARAGVLAGNPIHEDMVEFMRNAKLDFIVNVTINKEKKVTGIFAGNPIEAHLKGVEHLDRHVKVPVRGEADIVITTNGGYPLDRDIYQAVKGMDTAASIVRENGVVIIAAECRDGLGGHEEFLKLVRGAEDADEVLRRIREHQPIYDQWEAQILARILKRARVILVSDFISEKVAGDLLLERAENVEEALELAYTLLGRSHVRTIVIPEGPYVIPIKAPGS